jgi:hypothetical protein
MLADGTERVLGEAKVRLVWEDADGVGDEYELDEIQKLMLIQPDLFIAPGVMEHPGSPEHPEDKGKKIGVLGLALRDPESGISIETPMPLGFALDLAQRIPHDVLAAQEMLPPEKLTVHRTMPSALRNPPGNGAL